MAIIFIATVPGVLTVLPNPLPNAVNGVFYSVTLTITGGVAPYSMFSGPSWASFNASTSVLSGTPNANGSVTVVMQDSTP